MDITRKNVEAILTNHSGFIRLDSLVKELGMVLNDENLWIVHDKLVQSVLPAFKQDCLEGERENAVVLVSFNRRAQHKLTDAQFGVDSKGEPVPMPDKPAKLIKKARDKVKAAERDKVLIAAGLKKEQAETEKYIPGIVFVDASWFTRDDIAESFQRELVDYLGDLDEEDLLHGAEVKFCKPGHGNTVMVTLHIPVKSEE